MKRWKSIFSGVLTSVVLFSAMGATVSAVESEDELVRARIELAEQLGLAESVNEQGYLSKDFLESKSTGELERMGVAALIRSYVPGMKARRAAAYAAGISGTVTASELVRYMNTVVGYFEVDGIQAFCAEHGVDRPLVGDRTSAPQLVSDTMQRKVLYYGYTGPGQWSGIKGFEQGRTVTSLALSYYYSGAGSLNWNIHGNYSTQMGLSDFIYYIEQVDTPPDSFQVFKVQTGNGSTQDMMYWQYRPRGYLCLSKKSEDTAVTSVSEYYSLEGAQYGVYSDKKCSVQVVTADSGVKAVLTTDSSGQSNIICLNEGTYYIKEIRAPKGYILNDEIVPVTISAGHTSSDPNVAEVYDSPVTVEIILKKESSDPGVTEGNINYSLKGAEYTIYRNEACTSRAGMIVTDENGRGSIQGLPLGKYWVKETKASPGFEKDEQVYPLDVFSGNGSVIEKTLCVEEVPVMLPLSVLLKKVDAETLGKAQGTGTLENALFRVRFYGTIEEDDPSKLGHEPLKEWVMRTNESGLLIYDEQYLVSGDEFYYDHDGNCALPYGTVTFEEIRAPEGYLLNPEVITVCVEETEKETAAYQIPVQKENVLSLELKKVQSITEKSIAEVVFEHFRPDGTKKTYTTDENGRIILKGLRRGKHVIKEILAPDGLEVNKNEICFTVEEDNSIKVMSEADVTEVDGDIIITREDSGHLNVIVENKPSPFRLYVHKFNEKQQELEGAGFTLFRDKTCREIVQSAVTCEDGMLCMEGLIPGQTYYLKETSAPVGYSIPTDKEGKDLIWEITAFSDVAAGEFLVYVNGEKYSDGSGDIFIKGNEKEREVHMNIVNETGNLLPMTGSVRGLILAVVGSALAIISVFAAAKKRRISG